MRLGIGSGMISWFCFFVNVSLSNIPFWGGWISSWAWLIIDASGSFVFQYVEAVWGLKILCLCLEDSFKINMKKGTHTHKHAHTHTHIRDQLLNLGVSFCCWMFDTFDREILSWVYDKPRFNGSSTMLISVLKENGKKL